MPDVVDNTAMSETKTGKHGLPTYRLPYNADERTTPKNQMRSYAIKVLAVIADLSRPERECVLRKAFKLNRENV